MFGETYLELFLYRVNKTGKIISEVQQVICATIATVTSILFDESPPVWALIAFVSGHSRKALALSCLSVATYSD